VTETLGRNSGQEVKGERNFRQTSRQEVKGDGNIRAGQEL
jgi:hypothetical protein